MVIALVSLIGHVLGQPVIDVERDGVVLRPRRAGENLVGLGAQLRVPRGAVVIQPAEGHLRRRAKSRGGGDVVAAEPEIVRQDHELIEAGRDRIEIPALHRDVLPRENPGAQLLGELWVCRADGRAVADRAAVKGDDLGRLGARDVQAAAAGKTQHRREQQRSDALFPGHGQPSQLLFPYLITVWTLFG